MSSSLFDSGVGDYSYYYVPTKYVDGDKRFEDVDKGDILYFVSCGGELEEIQKLIDYEIFIPF